MSDPKSVPSEIDVQFPFALLRRSGGRSTSFVGFGFLSLLVEVPCRGMVVALRDGASNCSRQRIDLLLDSKGWESLIPPGDSATEDRRRVSPSSSLPSFDDLYGHGVLPCIRRKSFWVSSRRGEVGRRRGCAEDVSEEGGERPTRRRRPREFRRSDRRGVRSRVDFSFLDRRRRLRVRRSEVG